MLQQVTRSWNIKFIERKCSNIGAVKRAQAVGNLTLVVQEEITARRLMRILVDCLALLVTLAMKVTKLWKVAANYRPKSSYPWPLCRA